MFDDGFVTMQHMVRYLRSQNRFKSVTSDKVRELARMCPKQRFEIQVRDGVECIRAAQGHTLKTVEADKLLTAVDTPTAIPTCIHGTTRAAFPLICSSGGLSRMERQHIHFAAGMPGSAEVRSGFRYDCQVLLHIDVAAAMAAGIKFYRSSNNVILSPGLEVGSSLGPAGFLPLQFICRAVDRRSGESLPIPEAIGGGGGSAPASTSQPKPLTAASSSPRQACVVDASRLRLFPCDRVVAAALHTASFTPTVVELPATVVDLSSGKVTDTFHVYIKPVDGALISASAEQRKVLQALGGSDEAAVARLRDWLVECKYMDARTLVLLDISPSLDPASTFCAAWCAELGGMAATSPVVRRVDRLPPLPQPGAASKAATDTTVVDAFSGLARVQQLASSITSLYHVGEHRLEEWLEAVVAPDPAGPELATALR